MVLWIAQEGWRDQSLPLRPDSPSEQGSAQCHPPGQRDSGGSCHPASSRIQPPGTGTAVPGLSCSGVGPWSTTVLCIWLSHTASRVGHWEDGVCRARMPMQREWVGSQAHQGFTDMGRYPQHRAERVTCNSGKTLSPVNVNISSLESLMKETGKRVACM